MDTVREPGWLIVERTTGLSSWDERSPWRSDPWRPPVEGEFRSILRRYRGFEGPAWPGEIESKVAALTRYGLLPAHKAVVTERDAECDGGHQRSGAALSGTVIN
jgi:hypothetical protein